MILSSGVMAAGLSLNRNSPCVDVIDAVRRHEGVTINLREEQKTLNSSEKQTKLPEGLRGETPKRHQLP